MNAHRMDQKTVERLLDGPAGDAQDGPRSLVLLLAAVRAAPHPDELAGEAAAMHAYRRARAGSPVGVPRAARGARGRLSRRTVRAALAGVVVVGTGGVAFAAGGGVLPTPLRAPAPTTAPSSAAPGATGSPTRDAGLPSAANPSPDPSASFIGLCRAYRADAGDNPGRVLDNPVFGDLIGAAGGRDRVAGYCDMALARSPGPATPKARPTSPPGNQPTVRPPVPPTVPPMPEPPATTGPPSSPATGRPTASRTAPATPGNTPGATTPTGGTRG